MSKREALNVHSDEKRTAVCVHISKQRRRKRNPSTNAETGDYPRRGVPRL